MNLGPGCAGDDEWSVWHYRVGNDALETFQEHLNRSPTSIAERETAV
jgi:hypothetical protein